MNKILWSVLALTAVGLMGWGASVAYADRDEHRGSRYEEREHERHGESRREREEEGKEEGEEEGGEHGMGRGAAMDPAYVKECGACHVAYPPGMLPERSWRALMGRLADHFGENAELSAEAAKGLENYLVREAGRGEFASSVANGSTPLRISETPKFKREHDELGGKPAQVKSMALCDACHTRAKEGSYAEREIVIPGRGRWE